MHILTYVFNFHWKTSFWKQTIESQTIHTFSIKSKDNFQEIAQLLIIGEILPTLLVIMDKDYLVMKIQIVTKIRDK